MADLIDAGVSTAYQNFQQINDFSSDFDFSVSQFTKIFRRYFARYRLELAHKSKEIISDDELQCVLIGTEKFFKVLRAFTSNIITYNDHFLKYGEKIIKLSQEIIDELENAKNDLLMIYQGFKKYNDFVSIHNTVASRFNSYKIDFKHDIIEPINQFMDEFYSFNVERGIYSLRINLILQALENFKRRLKHIYQTLDLPLVESVSQSILRELANAIIKSNS